MRNTVENKVVGGTNIGVLLFISKRPLEREKAMISTTRLFEEPD